MSAPAEAMAWAACPTGTVGPWPACCPSRKRSTMCSPRRCRCRPNPSPSRMLQAASSPRPRVARVDLPPFPSSAMDGFAVRAPTAPARLQVVGRSAAGRPAPAVLGPGEAIGIATGAVVPEGADAVVADRARRGIRTTTIMLDLGRCRRRERARAGRRCSFRCRGPCGRRPAHSCSASRRSQHVASRRCSARVVPASRS